MIIRTSLLGLTLLLFSPAVSSGAAVGPSPETNAGTATVAQPGRSLGISSMPNLRDLGGYRTEQGTAVAGGLVYRSDQLSAVSPQDMDRLAKLGLRTAYDLRTVEEREKRPDELPPGVSYVWLNVLKDAEQAGPAQLEKLMSDPAAANAALGAGKAEEAFEQAYRDFVSLPSARKGFAELFRGLAERRKLPALFHCTTGKDRTGWAAAALLTLLGVPKDVVMEDYLRSNDYILPAYEKEIGAFVAAGGEAAIPDAILGVKREYLEAAFDEMEKEYGSIEAYFSEGLGIDAQRQQTLRDIFLEKN